MRAKWLMLKYHPGFSQYIDDFNYVVTHPPYIPRGHGYWEQMASDHQSQDIAEWRPFEEKLHHALLNRTGEYNPDCLAPEDLINLIEQKTTEPNYKYHSL
jgi:hypothetical protein